MSKRQTLIVLGIWIIILPFLGFPQDWDTVLLVITGIVISWISYSIKVKIKNQNTSNIPFVESKAEPIVNSSSITSTQSQANDSILER